MKSLFLREIKQQIATHSRKTTVVVKHYGIECRSDFSTEGSFGLGILGFGWVFTSLLKTCHLVKAPREPPLQTELCPVQHTGLSGVLSGKDKAHKHKQIFPVTARVGGGLPTGWPRVSRLVARGQNFMCCVRNPKNINIFVRVPGREDRVPGREDR